MKGTALRDILAPALLLLTLSCEAGINPAPGTGPTPSACQFQRPADPVPAPDEALGWKVIRAEQGGRVDIPDGAWLEVPPGALDCDEMITVRIRRQPDPLDPVYILEPDGLQFNDPVLLHIPYPEIDGAEPQVVAHVASDLHDVRDAGSELTNWEPANIVHRDTEANTITIALDHFTGTLAAFRVMANAYLVFDIHDEYLRPGDIVFVLTNTDDHPGPNWKPGHVGMIRRVRAPGSGVTTVIESTPPSVGSQHYEIFKTGDGHMFLGARRPPGATLTTEERMELLSWATQQVGADYAMVFGQGNVTSGAYSCVGFVEAGYDHIDRGTLYELQEWLIATPIEMFRKTEPIDEVWVDVGDTMTVGMRGVVVDRDSPYDTVSLSGWYQNTEDYIIRTTGRPEGSTFEGDTESGYEFQWTPRMEDACETSGLGEACVGGAEPHEFTVTLEAIPKATDDGKLVDLPAVQIERTFTVRVTGHSGVYSFDTGGAKKISVELPPGAVVENATLIDEATGTELGEMGSAGGYTVATNSERTEGNWRTIEFWLDPGPSAGEVTLRYYVDYEIPIWRNNGDPWPPQ